MVLGRGDLVLCSGTLDRAVPFAARVEAASAAGFRGISLWGRDYQAARRDGLSDSDMRHMLGAHGLEVAELDPAWWWLPGASTVHVPPELDPLDVFGFGEAEIFDIADALGARSINAVDVFGGDWSTEEAATAFAGLCRRAADHGLLVHIEWLTWSKIADLRATVEILELAQMPNGGLNVDAWHLARAGVELQELRQLPGDMIKAVQLDDGPASAEEDLLGATLHERLLPGAGEFDLVGLVKALDDIGSTAPMGVEVFSDQLHSLEPLEAARRAARAARLVLQEAR
jgi:sugar phosphate isomerase/epimerase